MAIKNIPEISGPNFGGVIYSLDLQSGFSSSPSTLTLRIINSSGQYATPTLNQNANIRFGSFSFRGIIWGYSFKRDSGESTLEVEIRDNSVILDRTPVVLWRRGLLGISGAAETKDVKVTLNETVLVPKFTGSGFSFNSQKLSDQTVKRTRHSYNGRVGKVILLGTEEMPDSNCDIPSTNYTFNDLKSVWGIKANGAPSDKSIKQTYEGTLREVLNNWCSDLGFDYFWDYSSDTVQFYNVANGIGNIPTSVTGPSIISKSESLSMEGSFRQYGVAYTAKPKSPFKELTGSASSWSTYNINPVPYSYFLKKTVASSSEGEDMGDMKIAKRSARDILNAGLLGHASRVLRDIWLYTTYPLSSSLNWLGYTYGISIDKKKSLALLKLNGYDGAIESLEKVFGAGLPGHTAYLTSYDERISESLVSGEQELLPNVGRWYRSSVQGGSSFYCNADSVVEIDFSVDPEPTVVEPNSPNFAGRKMIDRGGSLSADTLGLQDVLGGSNNDFITKAQQAMPYSVGLKESGVAAALVQAQIMTEEQLKKFNMLSFFPNPELVKSLVPFSVSFGRSNNPLESTYREISTSQASSGQQKCKSYEDRLAKSQCKSAQEEARETAMRNLQPPEEDDNQVSGLVNKSAYHCKISMSGGGSATIHAASDGQHRVVYRWSAQVKKIDATNTSQKITSSGAIGDADNVAEIRVNIDNVTTSTDQFGAVSQDTKSRKTPNVSCGYQGKVSYTFAGEPVGIPLTPSRGLSQLSITLGSDGFTTSAEYQTRPPKPAKADATIRTANSQLNRASFNAN